MADVNNRTTRSTVERPNVWSPGRFNAVDRQWEEAAESVVEHCVRLSVLQHRPTRIRSGLSCSFRLV